MRTLIIASFSSLALAVPVEKHTYISRTNVSAKTFAQNTDWIGQVAEATVDCLLFDATSTPVTLALQSDRAPIATSTTSSLRFASSISIYTTTPPVSHPHPSTPVVSEPKPTKPPVGTGESYTGSYTLNYYGGGLGACGDPINDNDMAVALSVELFGDATVDYMTGKTTNKWCGKTIAITNGDVTVNAKIMDRCPGCTGGGLDATPALWEATTGGLGGASGSRIYSMSWRVVV